MKFFEEHLAELERNMDLLESQPLLIYFKAQKGIEVCQKVLQIFRKKISEGGLKNKEMECQFFKAIKPKVVGYMIHFINLVHMERHRNCGRDKAKHKFYKEQIVYLRQYFLEHREFYEYYVRNLSHRDNEFFSRKPQATELDCSAITSLIDDTFSTSHDIILAHIMGNSLTIKYLQNKIIHSEQNYHRHSNKPSSHLKWTGTKIDLVELVYALQASNMINNGNVEIKELAKGVENLFSIDIGDYYRTFLEIRLRKNNQTKLLDFLKTCIQNKIVEADG